jgi:hypothetical protein
VAAPAAPLAAFIPMLHAAGLATQADVANATAPLATTAQVTALQLQVNAVLLRVNALPTLAQVQAAIAAALVPHNSPAIAAAASASAPAVVNARAANSHSRSGVAYAVVPRADGTPPPNWPVGFDRAALRAGPIDAVTALLNDYGLLPPAAAFDRRSVLALHIGTADL